MAAFIWHKHPHTPPGTGLEQLPFISLQGRKYPHTQAPWVISWDRDPSHPSGEDMAFRNGLRVPKLTHSASQQENSVTGLVVSKPCLVCSLWGRSSGGQPGGFTFCASTAIWWWHMVSWGTGQLRSLPCKNTKQLCILSMISVNQTHSQLSQNWTPPLMGRQFGWAKWCSSVTLLRGKIVLVCCTTVIFPHLYYGFPLLPRES